MQEEQSNSRIMMLGRKFPVVFGGALLISFLSWSLFYLSADIGWSIVAGAIVFLSTMLIGSYSQTRGLSIVWWFGSLLGMITISTVWDYFGIGSLEIFRDVFEGMAVFFMILYLTPPLILIFYLFASYNSGRVTTGQKLVNWLYFWNFFSPMNRAEQEQEEKLVYQVPPLGKIHNSFMDFFYQNALSKYFTLMVINVILLILVMFLY